MFTRRQISSAGLLASAALCLSPATARLLAGNLGSLSQIARNKGILFGSMTSDRSLMDIQFLNILQSECDICGPINSLKWHVMENKNPVESLDMIDKSYNIIKKSNMKFRGHCLVWDKSQMLPKFIKNNSTNNVSKLEYHLINRVKYMCEHFYGKVHIWDVVNEAVKINGSPENGPFQRALGERFMDIAFDAAHRFSGGSNLLYTDYVLPQYPKMQDAIFDIFSRMKDRGVPCNGLGIQGHISKDATDSEFCKWRSFLKDIAALGMKIAVTELDIIDTFLPERDNVRDEMGAEMVERFLYETLSEKAVTTVMTWGLSDRYEGLSYYRPRIDGFPRRPTPLDFDMHRKPLYYSIARAFNNSVAR